MTGTKQCPYKPTCCHTYVGDMFFIWPPGIEELHGQFTTSKACEITDWLY